MRLTKILKATLSKDPLIDGSNEDVEKLWLREEVQRAAVFDGASESFAARKWTRILADQWRRGNGSSFEWLMQAQRLYKEHVDKIKLSWAQEAAAERGSFATIASVEVVNGKLFMTVVGDSSIFFLDSSGIRASYPFKSETEFSSVPKALSSHPNAANSCVDLLSDGRKRFEFLFSEGEKRILLATDAVSSWLLVDDMSCRTDRLRQILQCATRHDFHDLVRRERSCGAMKVDDSTVLLLGVD